MSDAIVFQTGMGKFNSKDYRVLPLFEKLKVLYHPVCVEPIWPPHHPPLAGYLSLESSAQHSDKQNTSASCQGNNKAVSSSVRQYNTSHMMICHVSLKCLPTCKACVDQM